MNDSVIVSKEQLIQIVNTIKQIADRGGVSGWENIDGLVGSVILLDRMIHQPVVRPSKAEVMQNDDSED